MSAPRYHRPDLVASYQSGSRSAGDALLRLNERWIRKCVWPFRRSWLDLDDLLQEGRSAFLACIPSFDASKASLANWTRLCIRRHVRTWASEYGLSVRVPLHAVLEARAHEANTEVAIAAASALRRPVYLDEVVGEDGETARGALMAANDEPVDETMTRLAMSAILRRAVERLPRAQRALIEARLDGQTQYDVAEAKGVSHQAVSQMERKAVERLREAMGVVMVWT